MRLLEVQAHDTAIDQLRHKIRTLPERTRLAALQARAAELEARVGELRERHTGLSERQSEIEAQVGAARARKDALEKRLYAGSVSSPRELQAIDEEVRHLGTYVGSLEDRELELMEEIEPLESQIAAVEEEAGRLADEASSLTGAISEAEVAVEAEVAIEAAGRAEAARGVSAELLASYEVIRAKLGGVGAAELVGTSCSGCHLSLPAMEVDRIRRASPEEMIKCDNCGRILVRRA